MLRFTADHTPSGTPTATPSTSDTTVSSMVAGSTFMISWITGRPVTIETPQSPESTPPRKLAYCAHRGRSSPSRARSASTAAALA